MNSVGDDRPKWLSSSPRGDLADVELIHLLAQFFSFDAVAMVVTVNNQTEVRASWPTNRAGLNCEDSTESERSSLLKAAGGTGKNVLTAAAEIDSGTAVRIHGSRASLHEFPLEWVERALETLVRMFA